MKIMPVPEQKAMHAAFHSNCLICHSNNFHPLKGFEKTGLVKCKNCGFVFCRNIPTTEELIAHYKTYPRNDSISPITIKRYRELIEELQQQVHGRNWLDVGCGNGHLLAVAGNMNWKVFGTEFTDEAVAICRQKNISMQQGPLDTSHYSPASFDVISFIEVIEHINNPVSEIKKFEFLLKKGGILYITTPNFNSVNRYKLKADWNIIEYPEHLCYYTPDTLHRLLSENGFQKISLKTSGYSPGRKGGYIEGVTEAVKEKEEGLRQKTESNILYSIAKKMVNTALNLFQAGDTIKAVYRKG